MSGVPESVSLALVVVEDDGGWVVGVAAAVFEVGLIELPPPQAIKLDTVTSKVTYRAAAANCLILSCMPYYSMRTVIAQTVGNW